MDHDDTDFQSQNFQLAGEGSKKFPSGLRPFALPKLDIEDQLQGHLRFDNLIDSEVFFKVQEHENSWIEVLSTRSSVVDFSNNAFYAFLNRGPMSEGSGTWLVDSEDLYELYNRMGVVDDEYDDGSASARGDGMFGVRGDGVFYDPLEALGQHKKFMVLSEKDILDREEEHITNISDMFAIKKEEACFLLNHYEWDIRKLFDDWSDDEKRVRDTVGFLNADDLGNDEHLVCGEIRNNEVACGICLQEHSSDMMSSVGCRHLFCHECWEGYLRSEISDGSRCLSLRCPSASCNAMVHQVFVNEFARDEDKEKYARFVLRAYIESTKMTRKWCPAPGCSCAIEFLGGEDYNVSCSCGYGFCWNCTTEVHRPVKCEDVAKWRLKNQDENESENWLRINSKECPKCHRTIERNEGSNHMTCPCGFHFCWLCLREFTNHDDYYSCNACQKDRQQGLHDLDDAEIEKAKESLDRYLHYYMRWDFYEQSRKRAQEDLQNVENHITYLATLYQIPESKLNFMTEVLLQVIDCSIVNKWTYVYGYYLDDDSNIELFEFMQVEAERTLKKLRSTFDMELERMSSGKASKDGVDDIRVKLTTLTSATRECFENFVGALETGLEVHKSLADPVVS